MTVKTMMKRFALPGLAIGLLLTPVAATSADMATMGKCGINIADQRQAFGRVCNGIALSKAGAHGGPTTIRIVMPQYPHIVFSGPAAQPKPTTMVFTPTRVSYLTYRRNKKGRMIPVTTFATRGHVGGKCDVAFNDTGTEVRKMVCSLSTEVGKIDVKFKGRER